MEKSQSSSNVILMNQMTNEKYTLFCMGQMTLTGFGSSSLVQLVQLL